MPETSAVTPIANGGARPPGHEPQDPGYWYELINEVLAAEFLDVTDRTMQAMRQRGDGARFVRISSRCVKYRRIDLREYSEGRLRTSTSDPGQAAA